MKRHQGLTLIELMVSIMVLAILITIALPNYQTFVLSNRVNSQINEIHAALSLARSEAIKRNTSFSFCKADSETAIACSTVAGPWRFWLLRDNQSNQVSMRGDITPGILQVQSNLNGNRIDFRGNGFAYEGRNLLSSNPQPWIEVCSVALPERARRVVLGISSQQIMTLDPVKAVC
jgi:type IV fimbrial biogenesis protein FimT